MDHEMAVALGLPPSGVCAWQASEKLDLQRYGRQANWRILSLARLDDGTGR